MAQRPGGVENLSRDGWRPDAPSAEAGEREFYAGKAGDEWRDALTPIGIDWRKPYPETAPWLICIFAQRRGGVRAGEDRKN